MASLQFGFCRNPYQISGPCGVCFVARSSLWLNHHVVSMKNNPDRLHSRGQHLGFLCPLHGEHSSRLCRWLPSSLGDSVGSGRGPFFLSVLIAVVQSKVSCVFPHGSARVIRYARVSSVTYRSPSIFFISKFRTMCPELCVHYTTV